MCTGLFSSRALFFLERHLETSKMLFYDRVVYTAKLLRNDSSYELNTSYILRRPLRLPARFQSREAEFAEALGPSRWHDSFSRVFELPELDTDNDEIVWYWAYSLWSFISVGVNGSSIKKSQSSRDELTDDATLDPHRHGWRNFSRAGIANGTDVHERTVRDRGKSINLHVPVLKPLRLGDGTILDGPGLRAVMEETLQWLQTDDLDNFFMSVESVEFFCL